MYQNILSDKNDYLRKKSILLNSFEVITAHFQPVKREKPVRSDEGDKKEF